MKTSNNRQIDEIDLVKFAQRIYKSRKILFSYLTCGLLLGLGVAFGLKNEYSASSTFIVQSDENSNVPRSLGGLASLAGIKLGEGNSNSLPILAYPKLLTNSEFLNEILNAPINFPNHAETISYSEYFNNYHEPSVISLIIKYTIGLPAVILKSIRKEEFASEINHDGNTLSFSERDYELVKKIPSRLTLQINEDNGLITISFLMPDPLLSAQMAKNVEDLLQQFLVDFRIKGAKENLAFLEMEFTRIDSLFSVSRTDLANFKDANKVLSTSKAQIELLTLQSDFDLLSALRNELAAKLEEAKIQVSKDTPVFSVISPVTIPNEKAKPKRAVILIMSLLVSIFLSFLHIIYLNNLKENIAKIVMIDVSKNQNE